MLNIVIPMAGRGSRFESVGFVDPKPLIRIHGKSMIEWVISNIRPSRPHRFIFICRKEHILKYPKMSTELSDICPGCTIITVDQVTEGAACTVLLASGLIDNDEPLMIANSDQFIEISIDDYLSFLDREKADGLIMTFWSDDAKWSYCRKHPDCTVTEVVEKQVISNDATVGIYNFAKGSDFVGAANEMIRRNLRVNGEFYVAPVYNLLIEKNARVVAMSVGREGNGMHGLGTPEDLSIFLRRVPELSKTLSFPVKRS